MSEHTSNISSFKQLTHHVFQSAPYLAQFSILYVGFIKDFTGNEKRLVPRFSVDLTPFQLEQIPSDYQSIVHHMMKQGGFTTTQELLHSQHEYLEELIQLAAIESDLIYIHQQNALFSEYLFTDPEYKSLLKQPFISSLPTVKSEDSPFNQALSRFKSSF